jgi:transposase InsO family protein
MPWKETDVMEERIRFVVEASQPEASMSEVCLAYGISRKTGYKWLERFKRAGSLRGLTESSRRPRRCPAQTDDATEQRVAALREQYGWGSRKLAWLLEKEGIHLARSTIDQILRRRGLLSPPRKGSQPAWRRFERQRPNELVQMDFKGEYRLGSGGYCYPLALLDDHSRYSLGLFALPSKEAGGVRRSLITVFERYGVPEGMLMDHGTPWWSPTSQHGLTQLSVWLIRQDILLCYSGIGHPQTQGKLERFNRTYGEELERLGTRDSVVGFGEAFDQIRRTYNHVRPHESLGMQVPASRYHPSPRPYVAEPAPWEYEPGATVLRLNTAGVLYYRGCRYFVSEALAERRVAVVAFAAKLLVTYRHMHVREIDLETGRTRPLVEPAARSSSTSFGNI